MGLVFVILGTLLWALDTIIRYPLLNQYSSVVIVFIEHLVLSLFFLYSVRSNIWDKLISQKKIFLSVLFIGIIGSGLSTIAFTQAFSLINPTVVILLQKLQPFVAILSASTFLDEKIRKDFLFLAPIAILGAILLSFPHFNFFDLGLSDMSKDQAMGLALTCFAVVGWGISTTLGKVVQSVNFNESQILFLRYLGGFFCLSIILIFFSQNQEITIASMNLKTLMNFGVMIFLSGILGMYFYYKGLRRLSVQQTALAELFFPLFATLINWIILDQKLSQTQLIGGFLLISSNMLMNRK